MILCNGEWRPLTHRRHRLCASPSTNLRQLKAAAAAPLPPPHLQGLHRPSSGWWGGVGGGLACRGEGPCPISWPWLQLWRGAAHAVHRPMLGLCTRHGRSCCPLLLCSLRACLRTRPACGCARMGFTLLLCSLRACLRTRPACGCARMGFTLLLCSLHACLRTRPACGCTRMGYTLLLCSLRACLRTVPACGCARMECTCLHGALLQAAVHRGHSTSPHFLAGAVRVPWPLACKESADGPRCWEGAEGIGGWWCGLAWHRGLRFPWPAVRMLWLGLPLLRHVARVWLQHSSLPCVCCTTAPTAQGVSNLLKSVAVASWNHKAGWQAQKASDAQVRGIHTAAWRECQCGVALLRGRCSAGRLVADAAGSRCTGWRRQHTTALRAQFATVADVRAGEGSTPQHSEHSLPRWQVYGLEKAAHHSTPSTVCHGGGTAPALALACFSPARAMRAARCYGRRPPTSLASPPPRSTCWEPRSGCLRAITWIPWPRCVFVSIWPLALVYVCMCLGWEGGGGGRVCVCVCVCICVCGSSCFAEQRLQHTPPKLQPQMPTQAFPPSPQNRARRRSSSPSAKWRQPSRQLPGWVGWSRRRRRFQQLTNKRATWASCSTGARGSVCVCLCVSACVW